MLAENIDMTQKHTIERVYLDYNATVPVRPQVCDAIAHAITHVGNPSSIHAEGRSARAYIETARESVAQLVGGQARNVVFTSGGTEANNLILNPHLRYSKDKRTRAHLLVSAGEHPCVLHGHRFAAQDVSILPLLPNGVVDLDALEQQCAKLTAADEGLRLVVSVQLANNETGVLQPIAQVSDIVHRYQGLVHTDAVQGVGKIPVSMWNLGCDALTLSAHKIGGGQGVGALVLAAGDLEIGEKLIRGGGQERGARSGTENVAGIVGFGVAAQIALQEVENEHVRLQKLRDMCEAAISAIAPDARIFGSDAARLPNTICFAMPKMSASTALMNFDLAGVALSSGSACSSGKVKRSHVLEAMSVDANSLVHGLIEGALRISLGWATTKNDIEQFTTVFSRVVDNVKKRAA